jgi:16S rRNA (cytosine967-C5)-methyltransferase
MTPAARLSAAIELIDTIDADRVPAAKALKEWGTAHRYAGSGDRAAISGLIWDVLRRRSSSAYLMDADTPRARVLGMLKLERGMDAEAISALCDGSRFAPAPLTETERSALTSRSLGGAPPHVAGDYPEWLDPHLAAVFGDDRVAEATAMASRAPLDLRVNTLKANRDRILTELSGFGAAPTRLASNGIRIPPIDGSGRHPNVQAEPAFQKGWFEVQDEGSQVVSELAGAAPGMQVLDYCAGAGGKTLALSAAMENKGQIFAYDSEKARLAPIFDRLRRSDNRNVQVVSKLQDLAALEGQMDVVLIDAPCTGSGTWRRRPDAKWRLTQKQLDIRTAEQKAILDAARIYVKPGGRLVYITCSVFAAENAHQIDAFLGREPGFAPVDHRSMWDGHFPGREDLARIDKARGISLTPARSGTDGFYFAALQKQG